MQRAAESCGELRRSAECCGELRKAADSCGELRRAAETRGELQRAAEIRGELQRAAESCQGCGELRERQLTGAVLAGCRAMWLLRRVRGAAESCGETS
eukprot:3936233-Alexandrium_andersonii.AAC.1